MSRPFLHPAFVPVWRDPSTVQFGLSAQRAVLIGGLSPAVAAVIHQLDGFHTIDGLREVARAHGAPPSVVDATLTMLRAHGLLVDADESGISGRDPVRALEQAAGQRTPDRVSAALVDGGTDTGQAAMQARAACHVEVIGAGRVGAATARLLSTAGVGVVTCHDPTATTAADVVPGGLSRSDVGRRRDHALAAVLAAERQPTTPAQTTNGPHVVVIATDAGSGRSEATDLVRVGTPHLLVGIDETTGIVGPLVIPGATSCLRCHDLHRTDRDPQWPTVLHHADLRRAPLPACDSALATIVAGLAAAQVLGFLAGHEVATVDGTIETTLPHAMPRRRSWSPHPACGCRWSLADATPSSA